MSQENLDVARQALGALGRRDAETLIALADPEVEWHSVFAIGEGGAYRGQEGTRRYMRDLAEAWDVGYAEVHDALSIGNTTVLVGRLVYRGKGSGAEGETPMGWTFEFRRGRVVVFRAFRDPEAA